MKDHVGAAFFRNARMECKYIASILANEIIVTGGVVSNKTPKGNGMRFTLDVWADNVDGERKTVGTVEVDIDV